MAAGVYSTVRAFMAAARKAGGPPSVVEVAVELGVGKTAARDRLALCIERGLMEHDPSRQRGFRLTGKGKMVASA